MAIISLGSMSPISSKNSSTSSASLSDDSLSWFLALPRSSTLKKSKAFISYMFFLHLSYSMSFMYVESNSNCSLFWVIGYDFSKLQVFIYYWFIRRRFDCLFSLSSSMSAFITYSLKNTSISGAQRSFIPCT